MRKIHLITKKYSNKFVLVDNEDFEELNKYKWYFNAAGLVDGNGYAFSGYRQGRRYYMHRILSGAPKHLIVDHINRNGLDNRRKNLRLVTRGENCLNKSKHKGSQYKYKGVGLSSGGKLYNARIARNGKQHYLGSFKTQIGARRAYLKAAKRLHEEFAS